MNLKEMQDVVIYEATEADVKSIIQSLERHLKNISPTSSNEPTGCYYRCIKENGEVVAGVMAETFCPTALYVDILWVKDECRGKGYATALMNDVENQAFEAGCKISTVSTYTFQARGLYEKLGYTVFGTINNCPENGCDDFYLSKMLKHTTHSPNIEIHDATNDDCRVIVYGIIDYNKSQILFTQSPNNIRFNKCIKIDNEVVGGILSNSICWKTYYLNGLWVEENHRNKGYGTMLINEAEKQARDFGCEVAILETINPAMQKLCEKLGYEVIGTLEDYPEGHTRYFMSKKFGFVVCK